MSCVLFYYFVIRLLNIIFSNLKSLVANTQVFFLEIKQLKHVLCNVCRGYPLSRYQDNGTDYSLPSTLQRYFCDTILDVISEYF